MNLSGKRLLFYLALPFLLFLALLGFPPPVAPPKATRPSQEQSAPADENLDE
jgi:hypothetical protein